MNKNSYVHLISYPTGKVQPVLRGPVLITMNTPDIDSTREQLWCGIFPSKETAMIRVKEVACLLGWNIIEVKEQ